MKLKPRPPSPLKLILSGPVRFLPLLPWLAGCGFSAGINQAISGQEVSLETTACAEVVSHSDLIVSTLAGVLQSAAMDLLLPHSECTLSMTDTSTLKTLQLKTPDCTIDTPAEGKAYDLKMSLSTLALAATSASAGAPFVLSGGGAMNVGANLPIIGAYTGTAKYTLEDQSSFDPKTGQLALNMLLTYHSGPSVLPLSIAVTGTRASITGTVTGPHLSCTVSGSLQKPVIACQ